MRARSGRIRKKRPTTWSAGYLLSTRLLVTDLTSPGFVRCIVSIYGQTLDAQLEQVRGTGCPERPRPIASQTTPKTSEPADIFVGDSAPRPSFQSVRLIKMPVRRVTGLT